MLFRNFGKNIARSQFSKIINSKQRLGAFAFLKETLNFSDLCDAADYIDNHFTSSQKEIMFGNPLPDSYQNLGKTDYGITINSLTSELNWTFIGIRKYSHKIKLFLYYKEKYDSCILLKKYDEAERYLEKIETEVCYSLWTLENRFLINEYHGTQSTENKEFLSYFNSINKGEPITKSLAHFLSIRAEKNLSVHIFNTSLDNALNKLAGDSIEENREYYLFKLSFLNNLSFSKYVQIISYDFTNSIIDRYLTLRKMLIYLFTLTSTQQREEPKLAEVLTYIKSRITYLFKKTSDPVFATLKVLGEGKTTIVDEQIENNLINVLDKYTSGLYYEVELNCIELLQTNPLYFDIYKLYVKSLVFQRKQFINVGAYNSIQNQILQEMYKIISLNREMDEAAHNLLKLANNIASTNLSFGIIDFVFKQTKGLNERKMMSKISYNIVNPILSDCLEDSSKAVNFLKHLEDRFPSSLTLKFMLAKKQDSSAIEKFEQLIPEATYKTELANHYQRIGDYQKAIEIWNFLRENYIDITPVLEAAITNLFYCYQQEIRYDECIRLFVNAFFINNYIVNKIQVVEVVEAIKNNKFRNVKASIDLPIFFTIANAEENAIHLAFENFNHSRNVCKPSELIAQFKEFDSAKIIFFLKYTCGQEILKHSIYINGSKERLEERLEICRFLSSIDHSDKSFYNEEIKYISNVLILQKGLLELDESKIYVNEQGIIATELRDLETIYNRFKTISKLTERNRKVVFLNVETGVLAAVNIDDKHDKGPEKDALKYSEDPVYDLFKELFDVIKNKFLHSKFGIVAYLSTRIRHGVLLGEIRPIYEKHKLITQKEGETSEYRINYYWDEKFKYEADPKKVEVQKLLKEFSFSVDGLIFDLIKKFLQVKDLNANPDGWFDYNFSYTELYLHSIRSTKSKDFNQFCKEVFEILWERTDANLNAIRKNIEGYIANEFDKLFNTLENNISAINLFYGKHEIITEIKSCSTEVQAVIRRVSNWFKRSGTQTSDFKIENLIDIIIENINKSYPNRTIIVEKDVEFEYTIKGEFYTHFADLLRIFFDNILKHSDENITEIKSKIRTELDGEQLTILIQNVITNQTAVDALKMTFRNRTMQVDKLISEGKSGFDKAMKILASDLKNENNKLFSDTNESVFTVGMIINFRDLII